MKDGNLVLPWILSGVMAFLLIGTAIVGASIVGSPPPMVGSSSGTLVVADITDLLAIGDQIVTMLTAITIALYVIVGFSLQHSFSAKRRFGTLDLAPGVFFLMATFVAFYFGYAARLSNFEYATFNYADPIDLRLSIGWASGLYGIQAAFVALSAVFAMFLVGRAFVMPNAKPTEPEIKKVESVPTSSAANVSVPVAAKPNLVVHDKAGRSIPPQEKVRKRLGSA